MYVSAPETNPRVETVLVVDLGSEHSRLIARNVRESRVYSEVVSPGALLKRLRSSSVKGVIFSAGPGAGETDRCRLLSSCSLAATPQPWVSCSDSTESLPDGFRL